MGLKFSKQKPKRDTVLETLITQIVQEVQEVQAVQTDSVMTDTKKLQTEYAVQDKELQTTFPPVEICVICITKPNYTYSYEGLLKDAPHMKRSLTAEQWATQAEAALEKQRKGCSWVKHHTMMQDRGVQLHMDNTRNSGPQVVHNSWKAIPTIPCGPTCIGNTPLPDWAYRSGNVPYRQRNIQTCARYCYYKYTNELEAHYKTCTTCKDPVL
jgi:hypothetical protein